MWSQMILLPNQIQKKHSLHFSTFQTRFFLRKHNYVHQDDPTKTTILNEQFQSVFSRKSPNSLSSLCHMKRQESTDADSSMLDNIVTSKGIENNLNPHNSAGPDQIKHIDPTITNPKTSLPKVARLGNLSTNLEGCYVAPDYKKGERSNTTGPYPLLVFCVKP